MTQRKRGEGTPVVKIKEDLWVVPPPGRLRPHDTDMKVCELRLFNDWKLSIEHVNIAGERIDGGSQVGLERASAQPDTVNSKLARKTVKGQLSYFQGSRLQ